MEHDDDAEQHSSSDTSDEFDSEFSCEVCDKSFSGLKPLLQHEKGARHQRALRRRKVAKELEEGGNTSQPLPEDPLSALVPFAECRPCGKEFTGPESYHQHLKGRSHKKRLNGARILEKVKKGAVTKEAVPELAGAVGGSSDLSGEEDFHNKIFQCEECLKAFTGVEPFFQHLLSKVHEKTLRQKGLLEDVVADSEDIDLEEDVLTCRMCRMSFSGPENAEAHLKGRGHLKKLEQLEWKRKKSGSHKTRFGDPQAGPSTADDGNPQGDISLPGDTKLPEDTKFPKDAIVPKDISHPEDTKFPKDTSPQEDISNPEDTKLPKDVRVPEDINHPEGAKCLNDSNPQEFISHPEGCNVDETVPLDGSRIAEDPTESLETESSVWV